MENKKFESYFGAIKSQEECWGFSAEDTEKIIQACSSDLKILFGI